MGDISNKFICEKCFLCPDNDDKTKRAKRVLKLVSDEVDSVKTCLSCHINANSTETRPRWFSMVCHLPHLLIWARRKNAKYWPAKVMSYDKEVVRVRFFGGSFHKHDIVPVNKCFLYSKSSPIKTSHLNKTYETEFEAAIKVIHAQIFYSHLLSV